MYLDLPAHYHELLTGRNNAVLLETARADAENATSLLFLDPVDVLEIAHPDEAPELFARVEQARARGYHIAGYIGYDCGYHFIGIRAASPAAAPIAWLGVYRQPLVFHHDAVMAEAAGGSYGEPPGETYHLRDLQFLPEEAAYRDALDAIHEHIARGNVYQVDYTGRYRFDFAGSPLALYAALARSQRVPYAAYVAAGRRRVLSFSPELFFRLRDGLITTQPMKGTVRRGRTLAEDAALRDWLRASAKNRAENVMIVDLLRNDLGRIAEIGSVQAGLLYDVERYETVWQMTSTVQARLRPSVSLYELFGALFPCGSVTGAPKIRAMRIIDALEQQPRGVYTGAIGYLAPNGDAAFSVAIRTLVLDGSRGEMGVGSGIVADSQPDDEYAECLLKARFLTDPREPFELLESILWDGTYLLLDLHLARLRESAAYFGYPLDEDRLRADLARQSREFPPGVRHKVRTRLDRHGHFHYDATPVSDSPEAPQRVAIAGQPTHSDDPFLYHKTTRRPRYDALSHEAAQRGYADVLFLNERGDMTEGAISNVFIRANGQWITPPVECGLLNGVYRQHLLCTLPDVREQRLSLPDVRAASEVYICNAIRGLRRVVVAEEVL